MYIRCCPRPRNCSFGCIAARCNRFYIASVLAGINFACNRNAARKSDICQGVRQLGMCFIEDEGASTGCVSERWRIFQGAVERGYKSDAALEDELTADF